MTAARAPATSGFRKLSAAWFVEPDLVTGEAFYGARALRVLNHCPVPQRLEVHGRPKHPIARAC
jgi:hypothetical protein